MTLKERISADFMKAFKNKESERKNFLGVLKAAIQVEEKKEGQAELTDEEVMKILNKQVKNLNESIAVANDEESKRQLAILEEYMPKRMSREEVKAKIDALWAASDVPLNIATVMKAFATDVVDRKLVSEVFVDKVSAGI